MKKIILLGAFIAAVSLHGASLKFITLGTGAGYPSMTRENSCNLLQTSKGSYMIDAGGPVLTSFIRRKLDINKVRAVFITHMHDDHFGGLTGFLKTRITKTIRGKWLGFWPEIWLPDPEAGPLFAKLMSLGNDYKTKDRIKYYTVKKGLFYDDGFLKVTAIPNKHIPVKNGFLPSYCFLIEVEGKKILCTGDLAKDFSDFPVEAAKNADIVLCESTHFDIMNHLETFRKIRPGKLIFNHVAVRNERRLPEFAAKVNYPVVFAKDGDVFEL